jgi:hypothetical protein
MTPDVADIRAAPNENGIILKTKWTSGTSEKRKIITKHQPWWLRHPRLDSREGDNMHRQRR